MGYSHPEIFVQREAWYEKEKGDKEVNVVEQSYIYTPPSLVGPVRHIMSAARQ